MKSYSFTRKLFHWLIAVLIFSLFFSGLWMIKLDYYSQWYIRAPHWHKSVGLILLVIIILSLLLQRITEKPEYDAGVQGWERFMAVVVQSSMTLLVFAVIISGYLITTANGDAVNVFNWFEIPAFINKIKNQSDISGKLHRWMAYALIALVLLHALAALFHHFIKKDRTLLRMLSK